MALYNTHTQAHTHTLTPRSLFTEWTSTLSWHNPP